MTSRCNCGYPEGHASYCPLRVEPVAPQPSESGPNKYAAFLARQNHQRDPWRGIGAKCLCGKVFDLDADHAMHQTIEILDAARTAAPAEPDAREHLHAKCDCVPDLGPAHCHLCGDEQGSPVPWPECSAVRAAAPAETDISGLREARAETWDEAIAAVHAWWSAPEDSRPAMIVNPYGVGLPVPGGEGDEK